MVDDNARPTERREPGFPPDKPEVQVDYEPPPPPPKLDNSPVRQYVGLPADRRARDSHTLAPESLRELAFLDRINEIGPPEQKPSPGTLPRLYDEDYAILALLDRGGLLPITLIRRAVAPQRASRTVFDRMTKLYRHGLVALHPTELREHERADGRPPAVYSLTRRGMEVAQTREPPAISRKREWRETDGGRALRLAHDLRALVWTIELHRLLGELATDHWRTPRYATGRYPIPQAGSGRDRHPVKIRDLKLPYKQWIGGLELVDRWTEIKPDVSLELRIPSKNLRFDVLIEMDLTGRPSYNRDKFLAYDAFLAGWSVAHPRYQQLGRPAVIFISRSPHAALALAKEADETLHGRIGISGTTPENWYHAPRDHLFFAVEEDIHHGGLSLLALPLLPPELRQKLTGSRDLQLRHATLLSEKVIRQEHDAL